MYSFEILSRLSELGMLDYSAQPLAGATLDNLDPNQRVRLHRIIQNRAGGEKLRFLYRMTNWILHYVLLLMLQVNMFQQ